MHAVSVADGSAGVAAPRVVQIGLDCVPSNGGTTTAMYDFRRALDAPIVSFTGADRLVEAGRGDGVVHVPVRGALGRAYHVARARDVSVAEPLLASADLLIIHGVFRHHAGWAAERARRLRLPYWVVTHGFLDPWTLSYRRARKRAWLALVGRRVFRGADRVILATEREREKAATFLGATRTSIVHWPVDPPRVESAARARVRREFGIGEHDRLLLMLGRLHPSKGVLEAMHSVAAAKRDGVHLVVAGPESAELSRATCEREAAALAPARIHVAGPRFGADRDALFAAADGYINLSAKENFGYAVAEAVAAGLPVILSPGNDLGPPLAAASCGWLLKSTDEATAAIRAFADAEPALLRDFGAAGRNFAAETLSFDVFQRTLRQLARDTVDRHRTGR